MELLSEVERPHDQRCEWDPSKPPPADYDWAFPVTGDGLACTTDADEGAPHGYCFQPEAILNPESPVASPTAMTVYGALGTRWASDMRLGYHPFFAKKEDAVRWLQDRSLVGHVMRYAHSKPPDCRGPVWQQTGRDNQGIWRPYTPWLTAGVVAVVLTSGKESAHVNPMMVAAGFDVYTTNAEEPPVRFKGIGLSFAQMCELAEEGEQSDGG